MTLAWQEPGTNPDDLKPGQCVVDSEDADFAWIREGQEPPKRIRMIVRTCCAEATAAVRDHWKAVADIHLKEICKLRDSLTSAVKHAAQWIDRSGALQVQLANVELREQNLRKEIGMWADYAFKHHGNDAGLYNGLKDLARGDE